MIGPRVWGGKVETGTSVGNATVVFDDKFLVRHSFELNNTFMECMEKTVAYEPIDMKAGAVQPSLEAGPEECQARCRKTSGCAHFSFFTEKVVAEMHMPNCHLQGIFASKTLSRESFISGPASCVKESGDDYMTIVSMLQAKVCYKKASSYFPEETLAEGQTAATQTDVLACQRQCQMYSSCEYFTFNALTRFCHFSDKNAKLVKNESYILIGGPKECQAQAWMMFRTSVNSKVVEEESDKRSAFERAVVKALEATSSDIQPGNTIVILNNDTTQQVYGKDLEVKIIIGSPNEIAIEDIARELNSKLDFLREELVRQLSTIPGIRAQKVIEGISEDGKTIDTLIYEGTRLRNEGKTKMKVSMPSEALLFSPGAALGELEHVAPVTEEEKQTPDPLSLSVQDLADLLSDNENLKQPARSHFHKIATGLPGWTTAAVVLAVFTALGGATVLVVGTRAWQRRSYVGIPDSNLDMLPSTRHLHLELTEPIIE